MYIYISLENLYVDLLVEITVYLQNGNSRVYKFQTPPLALRMLLNSPFSHGPLGSGISSQQR